MRLARTTSKAGSPVGRLPSRTRSRRASRVAPGVGRGRLDGDRVGVDAERGRGAQLERGDGQDPRAAADVEDARVRHAAPIGHRLERGEAQPGRRMEPGPERHPRIEREDDIVGRASMAAPRRPDDQSPADAHDREVRLPGVGPVGLLDDPRPELPDRPQSERLQMAERLGDLGHRAIGRGPVARRQVGAHGGRPGRIQPGAETLVHELERGLDRCPARRHPAEDLADRLDRLDVGVDRQLEPGPRTARGRPRSTEPELLEQAAATVADRLAGLVGVGGQQLAAPSSRAWSARRRRPSRGGRRAGRLDAGAGRPCRAAGSRCSAGSRA